MSNRRHRRLPLPRSFKPERREHWLDRHERQVEEQEEASQPSERPRANHGGRHD